MNLPLLQSLSEAHGVPGQEGRIREIVRKELSPHCSIHVDAMGNMICHKKPTKPVAKPKKLMIAAHMDEIGFVVKFIDDRGFIRVHPLGGFDPRQLPSQRVIVHTESGPLPGTMMMDVKPRHMLTPEEASKAPRLDQFFVDVGLDGESVKAKVKLGDMVAMDRECRPMGDLVTGKAMDDRAAVYVMIEAIKQLGDHECEVFGVATVQEEIGLRGAAASGWSIQPDICVAIDVTLANDIPGIPEQDRVTQLGKGTAIKILDGSLICHPKVVSHFVDLAEKHQIPYQMELLTAGGTDAGAVQRLHGGLPAFTLSIPTRYIHTVNETIHPSDLDASVNLLAAYIQDCHSRDYNGD